MDARGNTFPISEGVPRLLRPKEAEGRSEETFDFKWRLIGSSYGFDDASRSFRQEWYLSRFGFETRNALRDFLRGKSLVLDAGTGSGVDTAMFAESEATIVAVDLSEQAALAAYHNVGSFGNVHVIQGDITRLPFAPEFFDFISCDQVLHHTPDTASAFAALASHVKPDGYLAAYVYKRKGPIREFTDDYIRSFSTNMTAEKCYELCEAITELGKTLTEMESEVNVPKDIPTIGIKAGSIDLQRFFYWNVMKCFWNADYDFVTNTIINFDWYHPRYAHRHSPEEVRAWYEEHGLTINSFQIVESGIAVLGQFSQRPSPGSAPTVSV